MRILLEIEEKLQAESALHTVGQDANLHFFILALW